MMQRRSLIRTALAAPFIARTPGLLMPVKPLRPAGVERYTWWLGTVEPVNPPRGELWFDTTCNVARVFTGTGWAVVSRPPGVAA